MGTIIKTCTVCHKPFKTKSSNVCMPCRDKASANISKNRIWATNYTEELRATTFQNRTLKKLSYQDHMNDQAKKTAIKAER